MTPNAIATAVRIIRSTEAGRLDNEGRSRGTVLVNDLGECAEGNALVI